jgi:tetratricopeptide (TPR) repeat protein
MTAPIRISLGMIVRDEEAMLPACLSSVKGLADEIVAVDTGSRDSTRAILAAAGARIVDFPWGDDFAAARNAGLAQARGQYVLVLDADERLADERARRNLLALAREGRVDCGLMPLHHASRLDASMEDVLGGRARLSEPVLLPRFLRRTDDLAYHGVVHENVEAWLTRRPRVVSIVEAPIVHYGSVPEWRAARNKRERNLRLLEARCRLEPENPEPRAFLAGELASEGELVRARELLEEALPLLRAARARGEPLDPTRLLTLRAATAMKSGALAVARETLDLARIWSCAHPNFEYLSAVLLEHESRKGSPAERRQRTQEAANHARRALERSRTYSTAETLPGARGHATAALLGELELRLGRPAEALAAFEQVLEERPDHLEAQLGLAEARIALDDAAGALTSLEPLLGKAGPEAWFLAAQACERLGLAEDARLFLLTCAREGVRVPLTPRRAEDLRARLKHGTDAPVTSLP